MNKIVPGLLTLSLLSMLTVGILISTKYMAEAPSLDNRSSAKEATLQPKKVCTAAAKKNANSPCYEPKPSSASNVDPKCDPKSKCVEYEDFSKPGTIMHRTETQTYFLNASHQCVKDTVKKGTGSRGICP